MKKLLTLLVLLFPLIVCAMEQPQEGKYPKIIQDQLGALQQACQENDSYYALLPDHIHNQVEQYVTAKNIGSQVKKWLLDNHEQCLTFDWVPANAQLMYTLNWKYASIKMDYAHFEYDIIHKCGTQRFGYAFEHGGWEDGKYLDCMKILFKQSFYRTTQRKIQAYLEDVQFSKYKSISYVEQALSELEKLLDSRQRGNFEKMVSKDEREHKDAIEIISSKFTIEYLKKLLLDLNPILYKLNENELDLIKHIYHQHDENKPIELTEEQKDTYKNLPICLQNAMQQFVHIPKETTFEKVVNTISNSNAINKLNDLKKWWKRW